MSGFYYDLAGFVIQEARLPLYNNSITVTEVDKNLCRKEIGGKNMIKRKGCKLLSAALAVALLASALTGCGNTGDSSASNGSQSSGSEVSGSTSCSL